MKQCVMPYSLNERPEIPGGNNCKGFLDELEQANKIILKCKQPSIFINNYNTFDDVCQKV